jgi:dihydrofolate synthase / folylpolyglutamate synthase
VEAGVGARYDATLALPNVIGSVLTNVDLDHVETLGPTMEDVARDKAAVARPGVPLVTGRPRRGPGVVAAVARGGRRPGSGRSTPTTPLARWPARPRARSELAADARRERAARAGPRQVLGWPEDALAAGLAAPPPPARFERFSVVEEGRPVEVILDGAHDPAAAARLAAALPEGYVLVFGSLARKQATRHAGRRCGRAGGRPG